jgi:hypothetical protein
MAEVEKTKPAKAVKVAKEFAGVPDGEVYPVTFAVGDEVTGELAELAIREGWAKA